MADFPVIENSKIPGADVYLRVNGRIFRPGPGRLIGQLNSAKIEIVVDAKAEDVFCFLTNNANNALRMKQETAGGKRIFRHNVVVKKGVVVRGRGKMDLVSRQISIFTIDQDQHLLIWEAAICLRGGNFYFSIQRTRRHPTDCRDGEIFCEDISDWETLHALFQEEFTYVAEDDLQAA